MKFIKALASVIGLTALTVQTPNAEAQISATKTGTASNTGSSVTVEVVDTIDWVITIENTGSSDLSDVLIVDQLLDSHTVVPGSLDYPSLFDVNEGLLTSTSTSFDITADTLPQNRLSVVTLLEKDLETASFELPTGDGVPDGPVLTYDRSDSGNDPTGSNPGAPGDTGRTDDPTPVPNALPPEFRVTKRAAKGSVSRGDNAQWTITVENTGPIAGLGINVVDVLPTGLVYVRGTGQVDGVAHQPTVTASGTYPRGELPVFTGVNGTSVTATGEVLTWTLDRLEAGETATITFFSQASVGLTPGQTVVNNAYAYDPKWPGDSAVVSNVATGELEITADALFDCSTVIGQVFNDLNGNGYQDAGETGVPTQRIVALVDGTAKSIKTDRYGRYHVPCASLPVQYIGSNIILKLDERRAPSGFRVTTENPRAVRLTAGKMTKVNFGVQIARLVELSLNGCAFEGASVELTDASKRGMRALLDTLNAGRSTLRLTYRQVDESNNLVKRRTRILSDAIKDVWRDSNKDYKLDIELALTRVIGEETLDCSAPAYVAPKPAAPKPKVEVIETITVEPKVVRQQQVRQVQQVQQQYVQQYAQQQYVLQGYVTQEQLQQGYQSGLIQLNENGQAYTPNVNGLNAISAGQTYGGVATGYIYGGDLNAAYGVSSGVTSAGAAATVSTTSRRSSSGAGSVGGSVYADPLTEETRRLLESASSILNQSGSLGGNDPLNGW